MTRETLGDFSSVICFKALITGMEDALGERATAIALIAAGRTRGKKLANDLRLAESNLSLETLGNQLNSILGKDGTRLCIIDKIEQVDDVIKVYTRETVCSSGEPQGSNRQCTYTLGAIWGAVEQSQKKRLRGKHTESVLRGGSHDVFEFVEIPQAT
ncbi:MAG: hydrocarbon-binding protein [Candidatus Nanopelagicaceae bacterium]